MIQIIKEGTKKIIDCPYCGCKFSYELEDETGNQHDGWEVTCPQCHKQVQTVGIRKPCRATITAEDFE